MLTPVPPTECMLACESASLRLDHELTELESARLDAHLRGCAACRAYADEIGAIAVQLRGAELERPDRRIELPRRRVLGVRFQAAVTAAAVSVVAVAAGSSFALKFALGTPGAPAGAVVASPVDLQGVDPSSILQHVLANQFTAVSVPSGRDRVPPKAGPAQAV